VRVYIRVYTHTHIYACMYIYVRLPQRPSSLKVEREKPRDATFNPVQLRLLEAAGHLEHHHKVGRVSRGRKCAESRERLVDRTVVDAVRRRLAVLLGQHVDHGQLGEENLGLGLVELRGVRIPTRSLKEES